MTNLERKARQRAARDKHLREVEASLVMAADLLAESKREIQRSRGLMQEDGSNGTTDES
jgi:hypothetical protein